MPSFTRTIEVAADPDTAWRVLGDLAGVDRWIPGVTMVEVAGLTRRCIFADGHTQREEILDYSPATRSYRYTIDGGLPVRDNRGCSFARGPIAVATRTAQAIIQTSPSTISAGRRLSKRRRPVKRWTCTGQQSAHPRSLGCNASYAIHVTWITISM